MRFVAFSVQANDSFIRNCTTWVEHYAINMDFITLQPLTYKFMTSLDVQIRIADAKNYQSLFVYTIEVCKLLNQVFRENLLRTWFKNLL